MKKILIFEVRSKTKFYSRVFEELKKYKEVDVHWIIQNPEFSTFNDNEYIIPFPKRKDLSSINSEDDILLDVLAGDRFHIHFGCQGRHYNYYKKEIDIIINKVQPDFILGELGNFFTHIGCLLAQKKGIIFFDIETARYPTGSLGFFIYDEWKPKKVFDVTDQEVDVFLESFLYKKIVPDYMRFVGEKKPIKNRMINLGHKFKILKGWLRGEKYCTQNPLKNIFRKNKIKNKIKKIDHNSVGLDFIKNNEKKILLYPMQMQPEFNIEVWGRPYSDQNSIIMHLIKKLPTDWVLCIKPNPKSYFEVCKLDVDSILLNENAYFVNSRITMKEIDDYIDLVVTVTGTVQIERLLNKKPVYILGGTPFKDFSAINKKIEYLNAKDFMNLYEPSEDDRKAVAKFLLEHSLPGIISEPINNPEIMNDYNVAKVCAAVSKVIQV